MGFLGSSAGKEFTCNAGDPGSILGSGSSSGEGIGYPLQYSCLENLHGQRSLAGYSPWGHKELNMTEQLSTAQQHMCIYIQVYMLCVYTYFIVLKKKYTHAENTHTHTEGAEGQREHCLIFIASSCIESLPEI